MIFHRPADDPAAVQVHDGGQIEPALILPLIILRKRSPLTSFHNTSWLLKPTPGVHQFTIETCETCAMCGYQSIPRFSEDLCPVVSLPRTWPVFCYPQSFSKLRGTFAKRNGNTSQTSGPRTIRGPLAGMMLPLSRICAITGAPISTPSKALLRSLFGPGLLRRLTSAHTTC